MHCKACDCPMKLVTDPRDELCSECLEIALVTAGVKKPFLESSLIEYVGNLNDPETLEALDVEYRPNEEDEIDEDFELDPEW